MTPRTPHSPGGGDVSETLSELERKLRELEAELATTPARSGPASAPVVEAAAIPPAPVIPAAPPAPVAPPAALDDPERLIAEARARLGGVSGQVDELLRFREQLQRTARELEDEYARVLARIGAPVAPLTPLPTAPVPEALRGPLAAPAPPEPTLAPPAPAPAAAPLPFAPAPPAEPAPAPAPPALGPLPTATLPGVSPLDDTAFDGTITLDAGPFTDIASLGGFEQGLARVPGAEDVYVSGFEGNRALIELRLATPVALVREMRAVLPAGFTVAQDGPGRLRVDVQPSDHAPA